MSLARFQSQSRARPAARSNEKAISLWEPVAHMAFIGHFERVVSGSGSPKRSSCSLEGRFGDGRGWSLGSKALCFLLFCAFPLRCWIRFGWSRGYTRRQRGRNLGSLGELVMGWVLVSRACMAIEITFEPDNSSLSDGSSVVLPESEMPILQTRVLAWLIW